MRILQVNIHASPLPIDYHALLDFANFRTVTTALNVTLISSSKLCVLLPSNFFVSLMLLEHVAGVLSMNSFEPV